MNEQQSQRHIPKHTQTYLKKYFKENQTHKENTIPTSHSPLENNKNSETNDTIGDPIITKDDNTFRIAFQNIHGLQFDNEGGKFQLLTATVEGLQIDFVGVAETNIDNTKLLVKQTIHKVAQKFHQQYKLTMAGTPFQYKTNYKPDGVISYLTKDFLSRHVRSSDDP